VVRNVGVIKQDMGGDLIDCFNVEEGKKRFIMQAWNRAELSLRGKNTPGHM